MLKPHLLFCFFGAFGVLEAWASAGGEGLLLLDEEEERRDVDVDAVDRRVVEVLVIVFVGPAGWWALSLIRSPSDDSQPYDSLRSNFLRVSFLEMADNRMLLPVVVSRAFDLLPWIPCPELSSSISPSSSLLEPLIRATNASLSISSDFRVMYFVGADWCGWSGSTGRILVVLMVDRWVVVMISYMVAESGLLLSVKTTAILFRPSWSLLLLSPSAGVDSAKMPLISCMTWSWLSASGVLASCLVVISVEGEGGWCSICKRYCWFVSSSMTRPCHRTVDCTCLIRCWCVTVWSRARAVRALVRLAKIAPLPIWASWNSGSCISSRCTRVMMEAIAREVSVDPNMPSINRTVSSHA